MCSSFPYKKNNGRSETSLVAVLLGLGELGDWTALFIPT